MFAVSTERVRSWLGRRLWEGGQMKTNVVSKIERRKQGKALREKCPRTSLAEWKPPAQSQDPLKLLEQTDADRIPGLIPLRYERMSESPFKFFRGSAIIQARDLAHSAVSGITVQASCSGRPSC
jgi:hypothetical protein